MEWECDDCSALIARLKNPKEPGTSNIVSSVSPTSVVDNTLASRASLKRRHSSDSSSDDTDVEVENISDVESSSNQ